MVQLNFHNVHMYYRCHQMPLKPACEHSKHSVNTNNRLANNDNNKSQESVVIWRVETKKLFYFQWWQCCLLNTKELRNTSRYKYHYTFHKNCEILRLTLEMKCASIFLKEGTLIHCWFLLCGECSCLLNPRFDFNGPLEVFHDNDMVQLLSTWKIV